MFFSKLFNLHTLLQPFIYVLTSNMEDVCEQMMDIVGQRGESLHQKVVRNLNQKLHADEFWSDALNWEVAAAVEEEGQ